MPLNWGVSKSLTTSGCHTALVSIARPPLPLLKPSHSLCSFDDQLYAELLVPVGKLEPEAYLHIVAYAVGGLQGIEREIRIPIRVDHASGAPLYRSPHWVGVDAGGYLYPVFKLYGDDGFLGATISAS